ncbi:MAG: hypothetical protein ACSHXY_12070 [Alphaproteobacteria bacterium]
MELEDFIPTFPMAVSLVAMAIQLIFGVLGLRRAKAETDRQVAETKKQEMLLVLQTEESYKADVRQWGLEVLDSMSRAQQLCTIIPKTLSHSDFTIERANTVARLRGLLNRAKWLFPNLSVPTREDPEFNYSPERNHSALETILYTYHTLDQLDPYKPDRRTIAQDRIRKFRNEFVQEMRRAVNPQVRGQDIEALVAELNRQDGKDVPNPLMENTEDA